MTKTVRATANQKKRAAYRERRRATRRLEE